MEIKIKIDPALADVELIARLVDRLADLAIDPEAKALKRDIINRLKRLKNVQCD
jgi:hypothetical protein